MTNTMPDLLKSTPLHKKRRKRRAAQRMAWWSHHLWNTKTEWYSMADTLFLYMYQMAALVFVVPSIVFDNVYFFAKSTVWSMSFQCGLWKCQTNHQEHNCYWRSKLHYGILPLFLHDITSASQKARMPSDAFEQKCGEWCPSWNITEFLCLSFFGGWGGPHCTPTLMNRGCLFLLSDYCYRSCSLS